MTLGELKANPTALKKLLRISGPPGGNNSPGNVVVDCPVNSVIHTESIELVQNAVVSASAADPTEGPTDCRITVSASGTSNCYWLPWGPGKVYMGTLSSAHEYFFTYSLNGCGFMIGGTGGAPIVAHANLVSTRLDAATVDTTGMSMHDAIAVGAKTTKEQALIYELFYGNLAATLIGRGLLTGARVEVVTPQQYLVDEPSAFAAVFGIYKGNWEFYGSWAGKTRKIWP